MSGQQRTYATMFYVGINLTIHYHHEGTADPHFFLRFFCTHHLVPLSSQTIRLPFSVSLRETV